MAPGETRVLNARTPWAYAWIDARYWFDFQNPILEFPIARVALGGQYMGGSCCKPPGIQQTQRHLWPSAPRNGFLATMDGTPFVVLRQEDTNYKRIDIWVNG